MSTSTIDPFDSLLNSFADVLTRDSSGEDIRGMADASFSVVASAVPCRVSMGVSVGKGKERRAQMQETIVYREVFMRPWFVDPSPDGSYVPYTVVGATTYNTQPLTPAHWLMIPGLQNINGVDVSGQYYDIFDVQNPGLLNHHFEVWCQIVEV